MADVDATVYAPLVPIIGGSAVAASSVFAETAWETDAATLPGLNLTGWAETAFSTDTATAPRRGLRIVQDDWS